MKLILDLETIGIDGAADFCDPVTPPSNWKDEAKIAAYVAEKSAERADKVALDLDLAQIVCLGWRDEQGASEVSICKDLASERELLAHLRPMLLKADTITFNGLRFDLPLIERRMLYLGLPPLRWNLDQYRTNHIDLFSKLSLRGAVQAHRLGWYRKRLGWIDIPETIEAGDVGKAAAAGHWDLIESHCAADVEITRRLAAWMGVWTASPAVETHQPATQAVF